MPEGITITTTMVLAAFATLVSAFVVVGKMLLASKDKAIADAESRIKSYEEISREGVDTAKRMADYMRAKEGKEPIVVVAPVVPESHSPSTKKQREEADIATKRAALAAIRLVADLPARATPPEAKE